GDGDAVLETRQGGLRGQVGVIGAAATDEFDDGISPQDVVIVLVLVIGEDSVDALADHLQEGVLREVGWTRVVEGGGEGAGVAEALVELAEQQQAAVAGQVVLAALPADRQGRREVEDVGPDRLYTHDGLRVGRCYLSANKLDPREGLSFPD